MKNTIIQKLFDSESNLTAVEAIFIAEHLNQIEVEVPKFNHKSHSIQKALGVDEDEIHQWGEDLSKVLKKRESNISEVLVEFVEKHSSLKDRLHLAFYWFDNTFTKERTEFLFPGDNEGHGDLCSCMVCNFRRAFED